MSKWEGIKKFSKNVHAPIKSIRKKITLLKLSTKDLLYQKF